MRSELPADDPRAMPAIVRESARVSLRRVARPIVTARDDVLVRVAFAGVCRTDVRVFDGLAGALDELVLGHELSGVVEAVGPGAAGIAIGARVSVDPYVDCRRCEACARGARCACKRMIGLELDGAFASHVVVPASSIVPLGADVPLDVGAFVEPVAAALAVVRANVAPADRGVVVGDSRIARLACDVLRAKGFERVVRLAPGDALDVDAFDFAVETSLDAGTLARAAALVRPRGRIVVKSRPTAPVAIDFAPLLRKEIALEPVWYGDFAEASALLPRLDVRARLAPVRPLSAFAEVFAAARGDESRKQMFAIGEER